MLFGSWVYISLCGGVLSLAHGVEAAGCQQWPVVEEEAVEGLQMMQVRHAKVNNMGKNEQHSGLKAVSDMAVAGVKEVVADVTSQLGDSDFEEVGAGCCKGPREIDNGKMWAGNAPDLATCQSKCREFTNCGAVEYGWSGEADKQWCFIWNDMQTCSALDQGPGKCGLTSDGVRAYKFLKDGMRRPFASEAQLVQTAPSQETTAEEEEFAEAGLWECHTYEKGQNDAWCRNTKQFGDHLLLYNGGKANMCGGCWCCKTRVVFPAPTPAAPMLLSAPASINPRALPDNAASLKEGSGLTGGDAMPGAGSGLPPTGSGLPGLLGHPALHEQVIAGFLHPTAATLKLIMDLVKAAPLIAFFGSLLFGIGGALSVSFWQRKAPHSKAERMEEQLDSKWNTKDLAAGVNLERPAKEDDAGADVQSDKATAKGGAMEEAALEKAVAEKAAADKAAAEKIAAEKAASEKAAAAKAAAERAAAEQAEAEKAVAEKAAAAKAAAEQAAVEQAAAEKAILEKAAAEEAAAEKSAVEEAVTKKAAAEKPAAEKAAVAAENVVVEKASAEKVEIKKAADEEAAAERIASESAVAEKGAVDHATVETLAAEMSEVGGAISERAPAEKINAEETADEKAAVENAAVEATAATGLCPMPATPTVFNLSPRDPIARWLHNDLDTTKLPEGSSDALDTNNDLHGAPDTTAAHAVTDDVKISKEEIRKPVADDGSGEQAALEDTDVDEETPKRVEDGMESSVRTSKAQKRQKHKSGKKADGDCQNSSENGSDVDFQSCGGASDADVEASA